MARDQHPDGAEGGGRPLADRLASAGVSDSAGPWEAWLQLRAAEGDRATVIDLYELVAAPQGLAAHELPAATRLSLARLLLIIRDAQQDGSWARLKACGNSDCHWAFYDRSHSRRGAWCSMASCGNLIKNRNLRARRSGQRRPAPGRPGAGRPRPVG